MKLKIENVNSEPEDENNRNDAEEAVINSSDRVIKGLISTSNNENILNLVNSEEDPLASPSANNIDDTDKLNTPQTAHLNNSTLWSDNDNNSEFTTYRLKNNSSSSKKNQPRYPRSMSVSNSDVQKEFWKGIFIEAERKKFRVMSLGKICRQSSKIIRKYY